MPLITQLSFEPQNDKTNKMSCVPSEKSSLCAQWVTKDPMFLHADSEDWADSLADLSLRWAYRRFYWFSHVAAHVYVRYRNIPKFSDRQVWANSADPDQTAHRGAV